MPRARRRCTNHACDQLAPCPVHTAAPWQTSNRRAELPSDWTHIAAGILERHPTCQLDYPGIWHTSRGPARCTHTSTEVDHIGDKHDHTPHNLRGVCTSCHSRRTLEQAAAGRRDHPNRRSQSLL